MTPEAQRIAIAEACGWKYGDTTVTAFGAEVPLKGWGKFFGHGQFPPDYLNDLNAMTSVANMLAKEGWHCVANMGTDGTWECFFTRSPRQLVPTAGDHYGAGDTLAMAMAEAFLHLKGKWVD